jgi:hypothetical protein
MSQTGPSACYATKLANVQIAGTTDCLDSGHFGAALALLVGLDWQQVIQVDFDFPIAEQLHSGGFFAVLL